MQELYPRLDRALTSARLYLTTRDRVKAHLDDFEAHLGKIKLTGPKRAELVDQWKQRMNNIGRLSVEKADKAAAHVARYAAEHADRSKTFVSEWLDDHSGASEESDARIAALRKALNRALGGG